MKHQGKVFCFVFFAVGFCCCVGHRRFRHLAGLQAAGLQRIFSNCRIREFDIVAVPESLEDDDTDEDRSTSTTSSQHDHKEQQPSSSPPPSTSRTRTHTGRTSSEARIVCGRLLPPPLPPLCQCACLRERERFLAIPNNSNTHTSFGAWSPVHARARRADRVAR